MDGTQWECNSSDTLLNDFFSQDDLKQLAVDAGIMLECPLLVLDDTFHVVAYYYPPGFVDNIFQEAVRCGQITYEAGAIISRSSALCSWDVRLYKAGRKFFPETFCSVKQCGCESRISGLCRHRWTPAADSVANMAHSGNDSGETIICQRKPEGQVV